jgi:integrase
MKVQQELMRHASIQTTMNVYGQAMASSKREANGKVVEMVLKPMKASAWNRKFCEWESVGEWI